MFSHDACPTLHKGPSVSLSDWALCVCVCVFRWGDEFCEQQSTRSCSKRFNKNKKRRPTVKRDARVSIVQQIWLVVQFWACLFVCARSCVITDSLCGLWGRGLALIGPKREGHTLRALQRACLKGLCGSCPAIHANPHDPHHRSTAPTFTQTTTLKMTSPDGHLHSVWNHFLNRFLTIFN